MFHLSTAKLVNDQELQNWGNVAMEELHFPSFLSGKIVRHPPIFRMLIAHIHLRLIPNNCGTVAMTAALPPILFIQQT